MCINCRKNYDLGEEFFSLLKGTHVLHPINIVWVTFLKVLRFILLKKKIHVIKTDLIIVVSFFIKT